MHFVLPILFVLKSACDLAVLYGNVVFSILVLSTKNGTPVFRKGFWAFQKKFFKVEVLKTFKIYSDYHKKHIDLPKERVFKKNLVSFFKRPYALSVGFKVKKRFVVLRQKSTQTLL